jgi:excisionase family DNA binding protein
MLDVHENTVKTWIRDGKLPASKHGGRNWKIAREDVVALIEAEP